MADGDKPYRVYKGGRVKGKVPSVPRPDRSRPAEAQLRETDDRPRWGRRIGLAVLALVVPRRRGSPPYLSFRSGVEDANERLPKAVEAILAPQDGRCSRSRRLILLLGTDGDRTAARRARRSTRSSCSAPSRPPPSLVSLDPARPSGSIPPGSARTRSTPPTSSAGLR